MRFILIDSVTFSRIFTITFLLPEFKFDKRSDVLYGDTSDTVASFPTIIRLTISNTSCEERVKLIGCILGIGFEMYLSWSKES